MADLRQLFLRLYHASTEHDLRLIIDEVLGPGSGATWSPYGDIENNIGVVENQQASPVPALIEKITNSIDAVLTRRCLEEGIDPTSPRAPQSIEDAVQQFFPDSRFWDLSSSLREQAAQIQILPDGPKKASSVIIYDEGEGQHPDHFETTFLSLLKGNKRKIPFVQGKYNMGATGALVFCGDERYQLIGSRRFDGGPFGFTLVRRHPWTSDEFASFDQTWYEFLTIDGQIPRFELGHTPLDLGLHDRTFDTGTVIKLYSYKLPKGSRALFTRDLYQSLNEYLFEPALPVLMVEKEERYPKHKNLSSPLFGLKRDLEAHGKYVEDAFSLTKTASGVGTFKIACYVFRARVDGKSVKETRTTIRREFFKNGMCVLFSLNGQVHGHYTKEFVTQSLKFGLLKDYVLVHIDCTGLEPRFRNGLFMASRDRLKTGAEASRLRALVAEALRNSELREVYKRRKQSIAVDGEDTADLLRSIAKDLSFRPELTRLLSQTFKLDQKGAGAPSPERPRRSRSTDEDDTFIGMRYPTFLKVEIKNTEEDGTPLAYVPLGGTRTIRLSTDVEDAYLDRIDDPGELRVELLDYTTSTGEGDPGEPYPGTLAEAFDVETSTPKRGTIQVRLHPRGEVQVGDGARIRVTLTGAGETFEGVFWARVVEKQKQGQPNPPEPDPAAGLPPLVLVREHPHEAGKTWEDMAEASIQFDYATVMHPKLTDDDQGLDAIYVNLDSSVLKNYIAKQRTLSVEQKEITERRYLSAVYFHTLFLYVTTQRRGYEVQRGEDSESVSLDEYLKDVFSSAYAEFLLGFETTRLLDAIE